MAHLSNTLQTHSQIPRHSFYPHSIEDCFEVSGYPAQPTKEEKEKNQPNKFLIMRKYTSKQEVANRGFAKRGLAKRGVKGQPTL